ALGYTGTHKVIAMTENGCLFDVDEALSSGNAWSYFCTWQGSFAQSASKISEEYTYKEVWDKVYQSENSITLGDMPGHTHAYNAEYAVKVEPTYTEEGYTENACLTCGRKVKTDTVPKKTLASTKITGFTPTATSVKLKWSKVADATGYKVLQYNSSTKKYTSVKTVTGASTVTATVTGLKSGTDYKFEVQPYVTENGKTATAKASAAYSTVTKPAKVKITKTASTKNSVTLKWKKVTASGYKVQQYNAKTKKWTNVKSVAASKTSVKITKLKKNTSYKFRIVAYKKLGSKSYSGAASATKTVKTKKK
ncbi:MAG: fibronectin type III domain-containing protein, partial [Ruminococcus sp.]|nr:fibronectin type III domain-containing protein [Ruminococcus sp.]